MYDRYTAFALVGAVVVWRSFPFVMVTLYAGIEAIPKSVLEAAAIDGARTWRTFWQIMVPMLRPVLAIVVIQSIIWDFKVFTQIYVMTRGGGIAGPEPDPQRLGLPAGLRGQRIRPRRRDRRGHDGDPARRDPALPRTLRRSGEPL